MAVKEEKEEKRPMLSNFKEAPAPVAMSEDMVRDIIKDELGSLLKSDRYSFHKLIQILDGRNIQTGKTTGTIIATAGGTTGQKLGFFGTTAVVQPASTGNGGFTENAGTAVNDTSTFDGDLGTTKYRINDIVRNLKNIGLLDS